MALGWSDRQDPGEARRGFTLLLEIRSSGATAAPIFYKRDGGRFEDADTTVKFTTGTQFTFAISTTPPLTIMSCTMLADGRDEALEDWVPPPPPLPTSFPVLPGGTALAPPDSLPASTTAAATASQPHQALPVPPPPPPQPQQPDAASSTRSFDLGSQSPSASQPRPAAGAPQRTASGGPPPQLAAVPDDAPLINLDDLPVIHSPALQPPLPPGTPPLAATFVKSASGTRQDVVGLSSAELVAASGSVLPERSTVQGGGGAPAGPSISRALSGSSSLPATNATHANSSVAFMQTQTSQGMPERASQQGEGDAAAGQAAAAPLDAGKGRWTWDCTLPRSAKSARAHIKLTLVTEELGRAELPLLAKVYKPTDKQRLNGSKLRHVQFLLVAHPQFDRQAKVVGTSYFDLPP